MNETPYKICLRLNAEEAEKLIANAKACGLTRTAYLRRLLNGHDLRPRPTAKFEALRTEIHQIGNNINQIARKANAGFASRDEVTRALRRKATRPPISSMVPKRCIGVSLAISSR